jgi:hypothetical protein
VVTRTRLVAGLAAILVFAGISTWLFAAEARGPLPAGRYEAAPPPDWPITPSDAEAIRRDALSRAAVRLPAPLRGTRPTYDPGGTGPAETYGGRAPRGGTAARSEPAGSNGPAEPLTCRYVAEVPSGTSAKFDCVLEGGEVVKVKYGRNSEIHAETAATRLLASLGYAADEVQIVPRVRCYGCPRFPFFTTQLLTLARMPLLLAPHGYDGAYTDFEWPAVERRFHAPAIETPTTEGWAWFELKASHAPQEDLDAFRLLAVFLAHWDNKSQNQRLVCLDDLPSQPDQPCAQPLLMIQDLGATFGPTKVNIAKWRDMPVWADRPTCTVSMRSLPYQGATFPEARISEAGRTQLARALSAVSHHDIEALFRDARFPEFQSGTDDRRDLEGWVAAFRHRVDQIVTGPPCPTGDQRPPAS